MEPNVPASMVLSAATGTKPTARARKEFGNAKMSVDEVIMSAFRLDIKNYIHKAVEERAAPLHTRVLECLDRQGKAELLGRKTKEDLAAYR